MSDVIRWGIIGTGKICRAFAETLRDDPGAVLAGVASRGMDKAQAFAGEFGGTPYGAYEDLAAAPGIDIVYIGTPHPMHADNALLALDGGKAVLCEKPFTLNRAEAERVFASAREKRLFAMEAMWTRFLPAVVQARQAVADGEIGAARHVTAHLGFKAEFGPGHRVFNPELGGGALLDLGIYPLSIAAYLLGDVTAATASADLGPTGVDVQTAFTLRHAGGGVTAASCSLTVQPPGELVVSGTQGRIVLPAPFHKAQSYTLVRADGTEQEVSAPYLGTGYVHQAIEAGRCLRAGLLESPVMTHAQTLALMGVMDDIRALAGVRYPGERA